LSARSDFEEEFPVEPFAPTGMGSIGSGLYSGYIAPGRNAPRNIFAPVPVGEPSYRVGHPIALPPGKSLSDVVRESAPYYPPGSSTPARDPTQLFSPPTYGGAGVGARLPPKKPFVPANVPVIDPGYLPKRTESESAASDPMEEEVAFWDDLGSGIGGFIGDVASAWVSSGSIFGSPATAAPAGRIAPSGPGYQAYRGIPLSTATAVPAPIRSAPMQDQGTCPPPNARYLRYNCQTGELSKIPRRRRRRLLTSSDLKDLAALKAIVGGGAKMDGAIVAAVRR